MTEQPLPGSIATALTLGFCPCQKKYVDGTPLYSLAEAFERAGVLRHWVISSSEMHLVCIYDAVMQQRHALREELIRVSFQKP